MRGLNQAERGKESAEQKAGAEKQKTRHVKNMRALIVLLLCVANYWSRRESQNSLKPA